MKNIRGSRNPPKFLRMCKFKHNSSKMYHLQGLALGLGKANLPKLTLKCNQFS